MLKRFISPMSAIIEATVTVWPVSGSCSWRLTPWMQHRHTVHPDLAALPFDLAETDAGTLDLYNLARSIAEYHKKRVQIGMLSRPLGGILDTCRESDCACPTGDDVPFHAT